MSINANLKVRMLLLGIFLISSILFADISKDYQKACKKDQAESYEKFLKKYPVSEYSADVVTRLDNIRYNSFTQGLTGKSFMSGLENYLKAYPEGNHATEAEEMLDEYRYNNAKTAGTEAAYLDFLDKAYYERYKGEAQQALSSIRLLNACKNNDLEKANKALSDNADVEYTDASGSTGLIYAINHNNLALTKLLLERSAEANKANNTGFNPLMYATQFGLDDIVSILLEHGADVNSTSEKEKQSVLLFAACEGFNDIVQLLISHGVMLNHKMPNGLTALDYTVYRGYLDTAEQLIKAGADVNNAIDDSTNTLAVAVGNQDYPMVCMLLKYGAKDLSSGACAKKALRNNYAEIVRQLENASKGLFDYNVAIKEPYPPKPQPQAPFKTNGLSLNSTGKITAINGRKITVDMGSDGPTVYRIRNYTLLKKPLPKEKQTDSHMYESASMDDFKLGDEITIKTAMNYDGIPLEIRLGLISFGSDIGVRSE